jgi:hypothetical protein
MTKQPIDYREKNAVGIAIIQAATAIAKKPLENGLQALSHTVQEAIAGRFIDGFIESWSSLVDEGKIKPEYLSSSSGVQGMRMIVDAANSQDVDEIKFTAVKNIFLNAAMMNEDDRNDVRVRKLMQLAVSMSPDQILVLVSTDKYVKTAPNEDEIAWRDFVGKDTGLVHGVWVREAAEGLNGGLLTYSKNRSRRAKLTPMGNEMIELMQHPSTSGLAA